jgi:hypothetical protein
MESVKLKLQGTRSTGSQARTLSTLCFIVRLMGRDLPRSFPEQLGDSPIPPV